MQEHVATPERVLAIAAAAGLREGAEIDFGNDVAAYERFVDTLDALGWLTLESARRSCRGRGTTPWEIFKVAGVTVVSPLGCTPLTDRKAEPIETLGRLHLVSDGTLVEFPEPAA